MPGAPRGESPRLPVKRETLIRNTFETPLAGSSSGGGAPSRDAGTGHGNHPPPDLGSRWHLDSRGPWPGGLAQARGLPHHPPGPPVDLCHRPLPALGPAGLRRSSPGLAPALHRGCGYVRLPCPAGGRLGGGRRVCRLGGREVGREAAAGSRPALAAGGGASPAGRIRGPASGPGGGILAGCSEGRKGAAGSPGPHRHDR